MELIKEIGKRRINGQILRFGIFKCPLCYNFTEVRLHNGLRNKSCGCIHFTHRSSRINGKHTRLYRTWRGMRHRCLNKNAHNYHRYGGRGIKICDEWSDFAQFRDWSFMNGYRKNLTIDRIDNNGDYEPSNCQFLTKRENGLKRTNIILSFGMAELIRKAYKNNHATQTELAELFNISYNQVNNILLNKTWKTP